MTICPKTRSRENPPGALPGGMCTLPCDAPNWYQYRVIELPVAVMARELRSLRVLSGSACAFPGFHATRVSLRISKVTKRNTKNKKKPASKGDVISGRIFVVTHPGLIGTLSLARHRFAFASPKWRRFLVPTYHLSFFFSLAVACASLRAAHFKRYSELQ